jgi:hypothetical protein
MTTSCCTTSPTYQLCNRIYAPWCVLKSFLALPMSSLFQHYANARLPLTFLYIPLPNITSLSYNILISIQQHRLLEEHFMFWLKLLPPKSHTSQSCTERVHSPWKIYFSLMINNSFCTAGTSLSSMYESWQSCVVFLMTNLSHPSTSTLHEGVLFLPSDFSQLSVTVFHSSLSIFSNIFLCCTPSQHMWPFSLLICFTLLTDVHAFISHSIFLHVIYYVLTFSTNCYVCLVVDQITSNGHLHKYKSVSDAVHNKYNVHLCRNGNNTSLISTYWTFSDFPPDTILPRHWMTQPFACLPTLTPVRDVSP